MNVLLVWNNRKARYTTLSVNLMPVKDIGDLKEEKKSTLNEIRNLKTKLNDQEQYSRRNCVRFFGVPETDKENTD